MRASFDPPACADRRCAGAFPHPFAARPPRMIRSLLLRCAVGALVTLSLPAAVTTARAEDAPSADTAGRRVETMAMSLREMIGLDRKRVENTAAEMAAVGPAGAPALIELLGDPVAAVRLAAVQALKAVAVPEGQAPLIARLGDEDTAVAGAAAEAVGAIEADWAVDALVRWLGHPDPGVRKIVMEQIAKRDADRVREVVRRQLASPPVEVGRGPFLAALGRFPDKDTKRELLEALKDPEDAPAALRGLGAMGDAAVKEVAAYVKAHARDEDPALAAAGLAVLASSGAKGSAELEKILPSLPAGLVHAAVDQTVETAGEDGGARLTALSGHKNLEVRVQALERMAESGAGDATAFLASNLKAKDDKVQLLAAKALVGGKRSPEAESLLISRYREVARRRGEGNLELRRQLLMALGRVGADAAVAELVQAIGRDDEVNAALTGLGSVGEPAIGSLLFVIKTGDAVRTPLAVEALANAGPAAIDPMMGLLTHRSRDVRNVARTAMAQIGKPAIVPHVIELLQDPETPGRPQLMALLGALYTPESFETLVHVAQTHQDAEMRLGSVRVLSQKAEPRVLEVLRGIAARDESNEVRHLAVKSLIWQGDKESVPLLLKVLMGDKDFIRKTAAFGLGYLAGPDDVPKLLEGMDTPRSEILTAARDALRRVTFRPDLAKPEEFKRWHKAWRERDTKRANVKEGDMTLSDGTRMYYALAGQGRPLVILGDGPDFAHDYLRGPFDRLAERRVVLYLDLPGRGRSTRPTEEGVSIGLEHDVRSVATMLTRLNLKGVDLYGHGWGAMVAVRIADKHPKLVRKMILDDSPQPTLRGWAARVDVGVARMLEPWQSDMKIFEEEARRFQPDVRDAMITRALLAALLERPRVMPQIAPLLGTDPGLRGAIIAPMGAFDLSDAYRRINVPTLMLYGAAPPLDEAGLAWRAELIESNSNLRLTEVSGAGLMPAFEATEAWQEIVENFLP
ncbi:MAG: alpha/beta fold hydrolase [Myxococcota bacterium]